MLLQHVLGVTHHEGKLYITDTYNNRIKVIDLAERTSQRFVGDSTPGKTDEPARFDEPEGISYAASRLFVADTNNHLIRSIDLTSRKVTTLSIAGLLPPVRKVESRGLAPSDTVVEVGDVTLKPVDGAVRLDVKLPLPAGWKINVLAPTSYQVDVEGAEGPISRAAPMGTAVRLAKDDRKAQFSISLPLMAEKGTDRVSVTVRYYYCQEGAEGLCKVGDVTWKVGLTVAIDGKSTALLEK